MSVFSGRAKTICYGLRFLPPSGSAGKSNETTVRTTSFGPRMFCHGSPQKARKKADHSAIKPRPLRPYPEPEGGSQPSRHKLELREWEIVISGELSDKDGDLHQRLLDLPRNSRGTIFFDSCGGSAFIGLALASLIRLRGLKATAVVAGECSSAALMPFAACVERYVTPHSTLLFHPIRWQSEEQVRLQEAAEWARHFKIMETDHDGLISRLFNCNEETIRRWNNPGRFVSGEELCAAGLAQLVTLFDGDIWSQKTRRRGGCPLSFQAPTLDAAWLTRHSDNEPERPREY